MPNIQARPWLAIQLLPLIAALTAGAVRLAKAKDIIHAHWLSQRASPPSWRAGSAGSLWLRQLKKFA